MRIHLAGVGGVVGSSLAEYFSHHEVTGNDVIRVGEAWRLGGVNIDNYLWRSSLDLTPQDLEGVDVVIDCAIGFADRPFGIGSPKATCLDNLKPAIGLLEAVRGMEKKPVVVYASSFNVFYRTPGIRIREDTPISPASVYGWTKASVEELYRVYHRCYGVPIIITRVASAYGPKGRSDELPHNLILHALRQQTFHLRSPGARRMWCFGGDVLDFYGKLLENPEHHVGETLHCAGNRGDRIVENRELAGLIGELTRSSMAIEEGTYEPGELQGGKPVSFETDSSCTRRLLNWKPRHTLEQGLEKTIDWFHENLDRYT